MSLNRMELCGRLFVSGFAACVWLGLPMLVVSIRSGESACISADTLDDGVALHASPAYFDVFAFITSPFQNALESSTPFYIFATFVAMSWTAVANAHVLWQATVGRQTCEFLAKAFAALMICDLVTNLALWLPPPSGFIQPGTAFYYYPMGFTASCASQLFSGRLAWTVLVTLDFWNTHRLKRSSQWRKAIPTAMAFLVLFGFAYTSACRHLYGLGTATTACATALVCVQYYKNQWKHRQHQRRQEQEEEEREDPSATPNDDDLLADDEVAVSAKLVQASVVQVAAAAPEDPKDKL